MADEQRAGKSMLRAKNLIVLVAATVLATLGTSATGGPANADPGVASEYKKMTKFLSKTKCVDVEDVDNGSRPANYWPIHLWGCHGEENQRWKTNWSGADPDSPGGLGYWEFESAMKPGWCIGASQWYAVGARLELDVCGSDWTKWGNLYAYNDTRPNGGWYNVWRNKRSAGAPDGAGLCMELKGNATSNGTDIITNPCDINEGAQRWHTRDL
jgi:hypothetical protein